MVRSRMTPYHPLGNGKTKRLNQTLLSMLHTLPEHQKCRWRESLNKVIHTYKCTRHEATGFSPYYLFFRRSKRLIFCLESSPLLAHTIQLMSENEKQP